MARIQTTFRTRVVPVQAYATLASVTLLLSSCATVMEAPKRSMLDSKCQERVVRMLNTVSPVVAETDIPKKFCGCFTQKVDVAKLEKDIDEVKDIALNPETLKFVTEYIPTIRTCAKETGLWKGL
jgi:hypothetical protein